MELDKFIKVVPGQERKVYSVDLHELSKSFQDGHHTTQTLSEAKEGSGDSRSKKAITPGGGGTGGEGPPRGEGDSGGGSGGTG